MWQPGQPAPQESIDLFGSHLVADVLQPIAVLAGDESVVQRLEADPFFAQLALGVLMPIQTQLGGIRKILTEFQEEGTEILVHAIAVEVVHHGRGPHNPWIALPGLGISTLLGTEYRSLLLGFPNEYHPFGLIESRQVLLHHVIFALTLLELHHRNLLFFGKSVYG